jgi:hypothetical protein
MSRSLFWRVYRTPPSDWTQSDLEGLTGNELEAVALLMGVPHSGTKSAQVARLMDAASLRTVLKPVGDDPAELTERYKLRELRELCKRAGIYVPGNKYGCAAALLNWRNACRRKGQAVLRQYQEQAAALPPRPRQLRFSLEAVEARR